jgi:outer membrane receptor protein involved in Fe transport
MKGVSSHGIFLATVSAFGLGGPAFAQQTALPAETSASAGAAAAQEGAAVPANAENQPSATAQGNSGQGEVVVTGSRIVRAGYNAPTPVTVLSADQLTKTAPSNIPDALNQLPQFQGSISQNAQADTGASKVRSGNYLDIRALGPQRVLILEDGRRVPPTSSNGATDTNLIPQLLVDRVDVVTGGASAAYGSDAVSGVVNFILNKNFTGLKGNIQSGISTYGDDGSYKAGLAFGTSLFDGRLHLIVSAERYHSEGIDDRASRYTSSGENIFSQETIGGLGTAAQPYFYVGNAKSTTSALGGYIQSGPMAGKQITFDGHIVGFNPGTAIVGRPGYGIGGDGLLTNPLPVTGVPSLTTTQLFGHASFDIASNVSAFAEVSWNRGINKDQNGRAGTPGTGATIFAGNAYLTPELSAALGTNGSFVVARSFLNWSPNTDVQGSHNTVINAGLEGKFSTFKWEVYYTHGSSSFFTRAFQVDNARFFAAADAVKDTSGNVVCRVTLINPGAFPGCVPLSVFGNGPDELNAQNYVRRESIWNTSNKMDLVAANISGEPFSLWAGPVGVALGAEYRHQSLIQTSNSNPAIPVDFTGLRGVNTPNQFAGVNIGVADGSYNVKELYGEIDVPLLKDSVIGSLDANGAARYTDYSTSGSVETWKLGASYNPVHDLRLRGTVSRDIRAPTLFELFAGKQQTTSPLTDLHTGLSQSVNVISSGNPDLKPEKALTYTMGAVFSPSFLHGFNVSVDYYNIKIKDAIAQPFTYIQMDDFCEQSGGTSPLCAQIIRPGAFSDHSAANFPTEIRLQNLNLARTQTSGLDFEASYRTRIGAGSLSTRLLATRLISYKQQPSTVLPEREYAGNADFIQGFYPLPMPKWRGTMNVDYSINAVGIGVQERYVGSFHISDIFAYVDNTIRPTFYTDLNLSYDFGKKKNVELYATINNLFNQKGRLFLISPVPGLNIPTSRNVYDVIGRYWTVGVKFKF